MKLKDRLFPLNQGIRSIFSNDTFRSISNLTGGNSAAIVIAIVSSIIQARFVSPEDLGYFNGFAIITGYLFFLNLGLHSSVQRLYPYYVGKGDKENAVDVVEICHAWNVALSAFVCIFFIGLSIYSIVIGNWKAALAWFAQAFLAISMIYGVYLNTTYTTSSNFTPLAKGTFFGSLFTLVTLPLFLVQPYVALAVKNVVNTTIPLLYWHLKRPLRPNWTFSWKKWFKYNKLGLPIFASFYGANILWRAIENTLVLKSLGIRELGLYSVCLMIFSVVNNIPQSITAVYTTKIIREFGRTENVGDAIRLCRKPLILGTVILILVILAMGTILPVIVPIVIPKYAETVPVVLLMLADQFFTLFDLPYAILLAMGRNTHRNIAVICGMIGFVIPAIILLNSGYGLIGLVLASMFGKLIRTLLTYLFINPKITLNRAESFGN